MAWIGQCAGATGATKCSMSFFNIVFGSSWLFIVIAEDLRNDAASLNNKTIKKIKASDHAKFMEHFCEIIRCYSDLKQ